MQGGQPDRGQQRVPPTLPQHPVRADRGHRAGWAQQPVPLGQVRRRRRILLVQHVEGHLHGIQEQRLRPGGTADQEPRVAQLFDDQFQHGVEQVTCGSKSANHSRSSSNRLSYEICPPVVADQNKPG